jgi:hypothetical protein
MGLDAARIRESLGRLRAADSSEFGADSHRFLLNKPLTEAVISAFETLHRVRLPEEYRAFLTEVGNGGAGPCYGVFPLGMMDSGFEFAPWQEEGDFVGVLSKPFPFETEWNDLSGMPSDDLLERDEAGYWASLDEFDKYYWGNSFMNGAIPICHEGCALRIWLVVTGPQAGCLWHDGRADRAGLAPLRLDNGNEATFASWYEGWLDKALRSARLA